MQKKFISNLILMLVLNLLIKPIAIFGIDATVQNRVGTENYGLYFSLLNLSFLFNIILDLGINNFTTKHVAQFPHIVTRYMGKLLVFRIVLFFIYGIISFFAALLLGYKENELSILCLLLFNQFLTVLIAYFRSHFSGLLLFKTDSLLSVADRLLLILFCGFALFLTDITFTIVLFIWIQTLCYILVSILAFLLLIKQIGMPKFTWHWTFSKAIVKKSIPYALLVILMMFYTRMDSVMIERIHPNGKMEAGYYAQGFRLLDAFFIFGMIFSNLLYPLFSKQIKEGNSVLPLLTTGGNLLIGGSLIIALFCSTNSEFILSLIYESDVKFATESFQWLMLSFVGMCGTLVFGTLLTANGSLLFLNFFSFVGIVINVGMNLYLIPKYGAAGSAFATFITQSIIALIQFFYCSRNFGFNVSSKLVLRYLLFVVLIIGSYHFIDRFIDAQWKLVLELTVSLLILFITRMVDSKKIIVLFNVSSR